MGPKCTEHTGTSEPLGCRGGRTHKARSSRGWEWSELDQPDGQGNHTPACQGRGAVLRSAEKWGRARPSSSPPAQTYGTASPSKRQCGAHVKKARSTQEAVWPKKKGGRLCQSVCSQQLSTLNSVSSVAQRIQMDHHQDPGHAAGPQNAQSRRARGKRARQQFHEFCSTERRRRAECVALLQQTTIAHRSGAEDQFTWINRMGASMPQKQNHGLSVRMLASPQRQRPPSRADERYRNHRMATDSKVIGRNHRWREGR